VVNATPRPLYSRGRDQVPIVREAVWALEPLWTSAENLTPAGVRTVQPVVSRCTDKAIPAAKLICQVVQEQHYYKHANR
jgi:hypothetical protein